MEKKTVKNILSLEMDNFDDGSQSSQYDRN